MSAALSNRLRFLGVTFTATLLPIIAGVSALIVWG
jgi:hypothetical protein